MIHVVLLSGGSGTRLWPLSNETRSKQFLKVLRDAESNRISMVQRVFAQLSDLRGDIDITIATSESQVASIEQQIEGEYSLVIEPERRDTAPAIMLACLNLFFEQGADPEDSVVVLPIDTFAAAEYYRQILRLDQAIGEDASDLILLGVSPTHPSEKYGYIVPDMVEGDIWPVREFVEKPDAALASKLIDDGALWNCGVFGFRLRYVLDIISGYISPEDFAEAVRCYGQLPKKSFDYEVVEVADSVCVIPYSGLWKDLGTWNSLTEEMPDATSGRVVLDEDTCSNTHVINETGLPLLVTGIEDSIIVATPDGILVSRKEASNSIKKFVEVAAGSRPMYEKRYWGEYRVLDFSVYPDGSKSLTKELILNAGHQLSYQTHKCRSEVWTVVYGFGKVVLDGKERTVHPGDVVIVEAGCSHAAYADTDMNIVEVQFGSLLEEEDIERYGYYWQR